MLPTTMISVFDRSENIVCVCVWGGGGGGEKAAHAD